MKQIYFAIALVLSLNIASGQNKKKIDFSSFDTKGLKTKIFVTDVKPFSTLGIDSKTYSMYNYHQSYRELQQADFKKRFKNENLIAKSMILEATNQIIPIGFIHAQFETVSKKAFEEGKVSFANNKAIRNSSENVFDTYTNTIITPLTTRKRGLNTTFLLDSRMFVNTTQDKIESIQADFDDDRGYITIQFDQDIHVNYQTEGNKTIKFKIEFKNGKTIEKQAILQVLYSNEDTHRLFNRAATLITATRNPPLGLYGETDMSPGKCEYEIFLSPDGILDKPIYMVDGFDPSDSRNITAIYNLLTYTDAGGVTRNLGDRIRNEEGYDVVIVNFPTYTNAIGRVVDGGADFIERNALSLVTVMEIINAQKVGTEQNVVIGPSMGGLISRYALRFMEQNSLNHQTRLWISFDSPHYGANVPIGVQHLFNYFAYGYGDSAGVKPLINTMLRSPAAKQMLVDHFQAHISAGAGVALGNDPVVPSTGLPLLPTGYPGVRNNFQNLMNTMGFPQTTRNVSMINGSGSLAKFKDKSNNDINPGFDFIGSASNPANIDTGNVIAIINTRALTFTEYMPNANVQEMIVNVKIQAQIFFWITQDEFIATAKQAANTNGVDSAPGGLFDMSGLAASLPPGDPVLTNFLNAMKSDYFCFIPAVSAMGLNVGGNINTPQPNYYHSINLGAKDIPWDGVNTTTSNTTPFKNWYMPPTNEGHVVLTQNNVDFAWCEIVKPVYNFSLTSPDTVTTCANNSVPVTLNISNIHGCNSVNLSANGLPAGANASFSATSVNTNGNVTMTLSNLPAGTHTINIVANNNVSQTTQSVVVTVNPANPNLAGTTQYKVNSGNFTTGTSVSVMPGANIELQIPSNLYIGSIDWFNPQGSLVTTNNNPNITNIQDGSADEGNWKATVTFTNDCARMAPSDIFFNVIVDPALATNSYDFIGLNVYPNPTNNFIRVVANTPLNDAKTKIIDLRGRTVLENNSYLINSNNIEIDLSSLSNGSYFLIIEDSKNKTIKQIVKQ